MYKRDYFVKQLEEFGKVLAILMGLKQPGKIHELENLIKETTQKYTGQEIEWLESLTDKNIANTLTEDKKLNDHQLKMCGDLLYEKAEFYFLKQETENAENCLRKAYQIYQFLINQATLPYSLDTHYKLENIRKIIKTG